jgi:uncharacterized cupin superfamily protein
MTAARLVRIGANPPAAEDGEPSDVLAGEPRTRTLNYFTDRTDCFFAGIWESTPGKWRVRYTENEVVVLLSGKAVLTQDGGQSQAFSAGEAFVIPAGFTGTWETVEPVRKIYAIYQPPAAPQ